MIVSVVHLVRQANGPEPLKAFVSAYERTSPINGELVLACKGFEAPEDAPRIVGAKHLMFPDVGYDIGTYRRAAELVDGEFVCFLNSFSRPLVNGWLEITLRAAHRPLVGIVGCTGSWEGVPGAPFPNPHIRTNAFVMRRDLFLSLDLPEPKTKEDACALEAGPNSITRQVAGRGLKALVLNERGEAYRPDAWHHSNTFRCTDEYGMQSALLVADNRTDAYTRADPNEQRYLRKLAWGEP